MKFINTDGMAFIGPGSEWFWTAFSGLVVAVTLIVIYRQLRLQAASGAREQVATLNREWSAERMLRSRLEVLVYFQDGRERAEDLRSASAVAIGSFWDDVGALCRSGHIDPKLLSSTLGSQAVIWWAGLEPAVRSYRSELGDPSQFEHFEWLARRMAQGWTRAGDPEFIDDQFRGIELERRIMQARQRLLVEQALRAVVVASPEQIPGGPPRRPRRRSATAPSATPG